MKCESNRKRVLLAQSGELSWLGKRTLARHLRACPTCRQFESDLRGLTHQARAAASEVEISPAVFERIRAAARRENSRSELIHIHPSREPFSITFRPAIIYTAAAILLLTGFWLTLRPVLRQPQMAEITAPSSIAGEWDTAGIDSQIENLNDRLDLAATSEDTIDIENTDIDSIARELLELEGQQI